MKRGLQQLTSFAPAVCLLLVSQFAINTGYSLLYPYLAVHMQRDLGLSAWLLGVVLGAGTLSQQGLFLIGGALSDRLGPRRIILSGLLLRTLGFLSFAFSTSLPGLLLAAVLSGFAGALFNPAVRAYLAQAAGLAGGGVCHIQRVRQRWPAPGAGSGKLPGRTGFSPRRGHGSRGLSPCWRCSSRAFCHAP